MAIHTSFYIPILKPQLQLGFSEVMALQLHHQAVKPWVPLSGHPSDSLLDKQVLQ